MGNNMTPEIDALLQRAADNSMARLAVLLDAIEVSALAEELTAWGQLVGVEVDGEKKYVTAKSAIASHLHYSTNVVTKLAAMAGLPDELIDLDCKPGMYWVAILNAEDPMQAIRKALKEGITTPGGMKRMLGIEDSRKLPFVKMRAKVSEIRDGEVVLQSPKIKPEDNWPDEISFTGRKVK